MHYARPGPQHAGQTDIASWDAPPVSAGSFLRKDERGTPDAVAPLYTSDGYHVNWKSAVWLLPSISPRSSRPHCPAHALLVFHV